MKVLRALLTCFLLVAAPLLSFDALLHAAEADGLIRGPLTILGQWTLSAHTLAGIWALVIEALIWVGVVGLRVDPRDWRAWLAFALGLVLSLGFQAAQLDDWLARFEATVPPLATAIAIVIFEWPRRHARVASPERASRPPAPARLRAWLGSWDPAFRVPTPLERATSQPPLAPVAELPTGRATPLGRPNGLTAAQRRRVEGWVGEGQTNKSWMARELGLSDRGRKHLGRLVDDLLAAQNGDRPKEPVS